MKDGADLDQVSIRVVRRDISRQTGQRRSALCRCALYPEPKPRPRSSIRLTFHLAKQVGITFAYWFNFGMSFVGGAIAWRLPVAIQALFAIFVSILVFALPESPRWLFVHGREEEAVQVLCAVFDKLPTDESILAEKTAILRAIEIESDAQRNSSFMALFKADKVRTRYRLFLAWMIQMVNQVRGSPSLV